MEKIYNFAKKDFFIFASTYVAIILLNWNPSFQFASLSSDLANRLHK